MCQLVERLPGRTVSCTLFRHPHNERPSRREVKCIYCHVLHALRKRWYSDIICKFDEPTVAVSSNILNLCWFHCKHQTASQSHILEHERALGFPEMRGLQRGAPNTISYGRSFCEFHWRRRAGVERRFNLNTLSLCCLALPTPILTDHYGYLIKPTGDLFRIIHSVIYMWK